MSTPFKNLALLALNLTDRALLDQFILALHPDFATGPASWTQAQSLFSLQEAAHQAEEIIPCQALIRQKVRAFRLPIVGHVGAVDLTVVPDATPVLLSYEKARPQDRRGVLQACIGVQSHTGRGPLAEGTTLLVRQVHKLNPYDVRVGAIYPGPVLPHPVALDAPHLHGQAFTALRARELGLTVAKLITREEV